MTNYFRKTLWLILLGLISIGLLNFIVDPLGVYQVVNITGFNEMKPKLRKFSRMAKPFWLINRPYERLVLGSSRSEIGIPVADSWGPYTGPGMNGAVSGGQLTEITEIFHHATLVAPIKTVAIGLDFFMFNSYSLKQYQSPEGLAQYNTKQQLLINQALYTLFSYKITGASLYSIIRQRPKYDKYRMTGQMNCDREARKSQKSGYPERFTRFINSFMETTWSPCRNNTYSLKNNKYDSMQMLQTMLDQAVTHNIDVKLFIPPHHAHLLEALSAADHWQAYENWKREMTKTVSETKENHPNAIIELWDFSGYNQYNLENFPTDNSQMTWHIDSSHITDHYGQFIIDQMYNDKDHQIGVMLTEESIDEAISNINKQQQQYRKQHPEIFEELQKRFEEMNILKKKNGSAC